MAGGVRTRLAHGRQLLTLCLFFLEFGAGCLASWGLEVRHVGILFFGLCEGISVDLIGSGAFPLNVLSSTQLCVELKPHDVLSKPDLYGTITLLLGSFGGYSEDDLWVHV